MAGDIKNIKRGDIYMVRSQCVIGYITRLGIRQWRVHNGQILMGASCYSSRIWLPEVWRQFVTLDVEDKRVGKLWLCGALLRVDFFAF